MITRENISRFANEGFTFGLFMTALAAVLATATSPENKLNAFSWLLAYAISTLAFGAVSLCSSKPVSRLFCCRHGDQKKPPAPLAEVVVATTTAAATAAAPKTA